MGEHHHHHDHISSNDSEHELKDKNSDEDEEVVVPPCACCSPDPAGDLEQWHQRAKAEEERKILYDDPTTTLVSKESADHSVFGCGSSHGSHEDLNKVFTLHNVIEDEEEQCIENVEDVKAKEDRAGAKLP